MTSLDLNIYASVSALAMLLMACVEVIRQYVQHTEWPKTNPTVGLIITVDYRVRWYDLVVLAYPAIRKHRILASARLLHWCEHSIMASLHGCQLGVTLHLAHTGPAVWRSRVRITAQCTTTEGRRSAWTVTVADPFEVIATGSLEFVEVSEISYQLRRVRPKTLLKNALNLPSPGAGPGGPTSARPPSVPHPAPARQTVPSGAR